MYWVVFSSTMTEWRGPTSIYHVILISCFLSNHQLASDSQQQEAKPGNISSWYVAIVRHCEVLFLISPNFYFMLECRIHHWCFGKHSFHPAAHSSIKPADNQEFTVSIHHRLVCLWFVFNMMLQQSTKYNFCSNQLGPQCVAHMVWILFQQLFFYMFTMCMYVVNPCLSHQLWFCNARVSSSLRGVPLFGQRMNQITATVIHLPSFLCILIVTHCKLWLQLRCFW